MFTLYKYCGVKFQFQEVNAILAKLLLLNKASETIQPALGKQENDLPILTFHILDFKHNSNSTNGDDFNFYLLLTIQTNNLDCLTI